ncbi:MAG: TAT-variant-translocated molybdopterin oxidoreductase [Myxococcales bacterium]|nr:TAT-variant-translocated molybdopterin oxidoreductase [Myxococcales bacterium]USN50230.1 MAG: TAT-variant-translocated molybdopterin oxidoreductase [Myxococcales bacterium]
MKQLVNEQNGEKITYWRSVDSRRRTAEYLKSVEDEFAPDMTDISAMDRRSMLKVMGASIALSGLGGVACRRPEEKILPYVKEPEGFTAGIAQFFATAQPGPFGASGILVESHEGRPTKVEGNPSHPESKGRATTHAQASVLEIYDPDRSRYPVRLKAGDHLPAEWTDWDSFQSQHFLELKRKGGKGLVFVSDSDLSPTFLRLKEETLKIYPQAKFFVHEPMRQKNVENAQTIAFGKNKRVRYHFEKAKVISSIFADPFVLAPQSIRHMRGYGENRVVHKTGDAKNMNRLYAVEADYSLAGTNADHRLRLPIGLAKTLVEGLAYELHATHGLDIASSIPGAKSLSSIVSRPPTLKGIDKKFLLVMAKDLAQNRGQALVVGGDHLAPEILAMIHAINVTLQGFNKVFDTLDINDQDAQQHLAAGSTEALIEELKSGQTDTLVMLGVNPVYDAPGKLAFKASLAKVKTVIHLGNYRDETAVESTWHLPQTHFLEEFSDTRAYDGSVTIIQPLIMPLHKARSKIELMAQVVGQNAFKPLELVKETYKNKFDAVLFAKQFDKVIHEGIVANSTFPQGPLRLDCQKIYEGFKAQSSRAPNKENLEFIISFDRKVLDGRMANHSWVQELPEPVTKINWDNALLMSPMAAREYKIKSGVQKNTYVADVVELIVGEQKIELPVFVVPGLNDYSVLATLGYGRRNAGVIGTGVGVDLYPLLSDYSNMVFHGAKINKTLKTHRIATTQEQFAMNADVVQETDVLHLQNRDPARVTDIGDYLKKPLHAKEKGIPQNLLVKEHGKKEKVPLQITDPWEYSKGNQWGMVIDLAKCTGCNACVIACQSENNIPVVGKEQVIRGRIMHWIRIDRYFVGDVKAPQAISQPIPCQHCENAPCEPVCPVAATSHDSSGLNVMTYNRCIGTRYCANNCPYKVRRFNYFDFSHSGNLYVEKDIVERQKTLKLQRNPDVTVRYRGVMEKCTYCTQRIQEAKMAARRDGRDQENLTDGLVTPACAQTCPSDAIVFGNINDPKSKVAALKKVDRNYTLIDVLNVRPRTSYLSKLRNPHPELVA